MILLWHFYWPAIVAGLVVGTISGTLYFRPVVIRPRDKLEGVDVAVNVKRLTKWRTIGAGALLVIALLLVWHGPLGAGTRLSDRIERDARLTLEHYEMEAVTARVEHSPLRRRLILSGAGDDVQQRELARIMDEIPGVADVRWANPPNAPVMMK